MLAQWRIEVLGFGFAFGHQQNVQHSMLDVGSAFAKKATAGQVFDVLFSSRNHETTKPRKFALNISCFLDFVFS
jgi:hypothetical protein